jgi:hypothetical protein
MKCSENLNLLYFKFQIRLQSFTWKMENKNIFVEEKTLDDRTAPRPRKADLKNGSC